MSNRILTTTIATLLLAAGCGGGGGTTTPDQGIPDLGIPTPPTITAVTPSSGSIDGDEQVEITGAGFLTDNPGVTSVTFGTTAGVGCAIVSDTTIRCMTPAGSVGTVDVTVTNNNGSDTLSGGFEYEFPRVLYAADGKTGLAGDLYIIDPATAAATVIGPIGYAITGLCIAPDGTMYGTEATQSGNRGVANLIRIDRLTGAGTVVGPLTDPSTGTNHVSTADCTFVGSQMVGWSETGDDLVNIDTATGEVSVVSNSGVSSSGSGIAMHSDGTLYFIPGRVNGNLYTINPATGVGFEGPALSGGTYDNINSLAFLDGVMYGVDTQDLGSTGSQQVLVTVDVATGALTPIGPLPTPIDSLAPSVHIPMP